MNTYCINCDYRNRCEETHIQQCKLKDKKKSVTNSGYKQTDSEECQSQRGKIFYYFATCMLLLLMVDKPYSTSAKGLHLFLRKCKRVCKLLLVQVLCGVFKCVDKFYKTK